MLLLVAAFIFAVIYMLRSNGNGSYHKFSGDDEFYYYDFGCNENVDFDGCDRDCDCDCD